MKFKPGNLLKNKANEGLWLVTEVLPVNKRAGKGFVFRMQLSAACVQPGKCKVNLPGDVDNWFFRREDGSDKSDGWILINEV